MKHAAFKFVSLVAGMTLWASLAVASPTRSLALPSPGEILDTGALVSHGYKGQHVRVGVISDGASNYGVLSRAGILPKDVAFFGDASGNGDEGDWMMQVVHDIAPGAKLGFCPADSSSASQVVGCARALVDQFHADIVVDDLNFMPVFWVPTQKDIAYGALKREHPHVLFFTGVGNNGGGYYQGAWMPVSVNILGQSYQAQDFGRSVGQGSRPYDSTSIPPGRGITILLGSNIQPGGAPYCASNNPKITLAVLDSQNDLLASKSSRCPQINLSYSNDTGAMQRVRIAIMLDADTAASDLAFKMVVRAAGEQAISPVMIRYATEGGAGNSATFPGLMAIAAVDPATALHGKYLIEDYANGGPQCLAYGPPAQGETWFRLATAHCVRQPRFVVPDRIVVAFPSPDGMGFRMKPFVGDSSAGPAGAGVAALLLSAHVPAARIESLLERTARPQTGTPGWNARYGYGLIDADAAAAAAGVLPRLPDQSSIGVNATTSIFRPSPAFQRDRQLVIEAKRGGDQALTALQTAAKRGDADAQTWLAMYDHGVGNGAGTARWCWAAAQQGQPAAEYLMGILFYKGWGVPQDQRASHAWWLRAARAGMAQAIYYLGLTEAESRGTATNFVNGYALMLAARQRGELPPASLTTMQRVKAFLNAEDLAKAQALAIRYAANPASIK